MMNEMTKRFFCFTFSVIVANSAYSQDICSSYLGKVIQPLQADNLWRQLSNVPTVKGEYETTNAFDKRVASAVAGLPTAVVVEVPVQRDFIVYDADEKRVNIQSYTFSNGTTKYDGVFGY